MLGSISTAASPYAAAAHWGKQASNRIITTGIADAVATTGDMVQISAAAKAASDAETPVLTPAQSARAKLDADYAKAKAEGTSIVMDIAHGGRTLDMSSLTDEEVAAVKLNHDGAFTSDESLTAWAELGGRLAKALLPFDTAGDVRGEQLAIKAMYPNLSQDVRDAMGWTPAMLDMGDRVIQDYGGAPSSSDRKSLLERMLEGQKDKGALRIDMSAAQTTIDQMLGSTPRTA